MQTEMIYQNGTLWTKQPFLGRASDYSQGVWLFSDIAGGYTIRNISIDELGFWNRTLNSSEITDLSQNGSVLK